MQLRSGRTLGTPTITSNPPNSPATTSSDASPSASAPSEVTPPHLPPELHQEIIASLLPTCTLRRHIVDKLLQQHHTPTHARHDQTVRRAAIASMDDAEKATYRRVRNDILSVSLASKEFQLHALAAERKWLERKPMDITAFRAFCDDPNAPKYADTTTEIVIELFPKADFIAPPPFINEAVDCPLGKIERDERTLLASRMQYQIPLSTTATATDTDTVVAALGLVGLAIIDVKIAGALDQLWMREIRRLPKQVEKVGIIAKMPDLGPDAVFSSGSVGAGIDREMMLKDFRGMAGRMAEESDRVGRKERCGDGDLGVGKEDGEGAMEKDRKGKGQMDVVWECVD